MPEKIVDVIFLGTVCVGGIGRNSVVGKISLDIIYDIWWIIDVSNTWSRCGPQVVGSRG